MKSRSLLGNTVIYGLAPQVTKVLSVAVLPFITPYLTAVDYGVSGVVTAFTSAISVFSTLGVTYILMLYFYKSPCQYKWIWRQIYGFLRIWQIAFAVIQSIILYFFLPEEASENYLVIIGLLAAPYILFSGSSFIGFNFYRFRENAMGTASRTIIIGIVTVATNLITIRHMRLGYMGWFISVAFSEVLLNALYYFPLRFKYGLTPIYNFKRRSIAAVVRRCLPLLPHYYSIYLLSLSDRVVMKILNIPTHLIGKYSVASTFGSHFSNFHVAVGHAIGPAIFSSLKTSDFAEVKKMVTSYFCFTLIATFTFSCWSREIIGFLFRNDDFANLYVLSVGIVMAYNYRPFYLLISQYILYFEKPKYLPYVTFVPGIISLILNFIFIPIYGIEAAVVSTFVCYCLVGFVPFMTKRVKTLIKYDYNILMWFVVMLIVSLGAYIVLDFGFFIRLSLNVFVIAGLVVLSRGNRIFGKTERSV